MRNKVICAIVIILLIVGINNCSNAATFSVSPSASSVAIGDTFSITIQAPGLTGRFNISASSHVTLNENNVWIEAGNAVKITGTAKTEGNATITVTSSSVADANGNDIPVTSKSCSITVKNANTPSSSGATITSLTVGEKTYSNPKSDITVNVENETDSINIKANTNTGEGYSISSTSGSKASPVKLSEGTTNIYVTLASGPKYTVRVQRAAKKVEAQPNVIDEEEEKKEEEKKEEEIKLFLTSLKVKGFNLEPEFSEDVYAYKINIDMDKEDVEDIEVDAVANLKDAKVEITGNKGLKEGENLVTITVNSADGTKSVIYQIVVNKIVTSSEVVGETQMNLQEENKAKVGLTVQKKIIVVVCVSIITGFGIFYAVTEYNYGKMKRECYDMFEEERGNINQYDNDDDFIFPQTQIIQQVREETKQQSIDTNKQGNLENNEAHDYYFKGFEQYDEDIYMGKKSKGKHF